MEYVTLTREDADFEPYLLGTFSATHRAIPVETYHPDTARERVTFRVVELEKLNIPSLSQIYLRSVRPELLGLTLGPAVASWLNHNYSLSSWTVLPSWLALAGIFFLHTAMFLFNDVQDHLRGADRMNRQRGSRVIQNGWVTAHQMRRWAWIHFVLAAVFGLPAFLNAPVGLIAVCGLASLALWIFQKNIGTRYGLCDLAVLMLFGPLITTGTALASFGYTNIFDVALGLVLGASTLWVFQVRQFEDLFRSKPQDFRTALAYLDFDRARLVGLVEGYLLLGLHPLTSVFLMVPIGIVATLPVVTFPLVLALNRFKKTASPLSGSMVGMARSALISHFTLLVWWIMALGTKWL